MKAFMAAIIGLIVLMVVPVMAQLASDQPMTPMNVLGEIIFVLLVIALGLLIWRKPLGKKKKEGDEKT